MGLRTKKLLAVMLCLGILFSLVNVPTYAAGTYNRDTALAYAKNHWNDGVGLCADFVSSCLTAGGVSVRQSTTRKLRNYLVNNGYAIDYFITSQQGINIKQSQYADKISPGDVLINYCGTCGVYPHVMLVAGTDTNGNVTYYAHNAAANQKKYYNGSAGYNSHSGHKFDLHVLHMLNGTSGGTTHPKPDLPPKHVHSFSASTDFAHPHKQYNVCDCGDREYLGTSVRSDCQSCYPLGSVSLTRSFDKTSGYTTFYRNIASNADIYSLTIYMRTGSGVWLYYDRTSMSSSSYSTTLPQGYEYYGELVCQNSMTGQSRTVSCASFRIYNTYTVSYNVNGGDNAPSDQTKIQDTDLHLTSSVPTRKGYVFKGWASSRTATAAQYQPDGYYTKNAKITLYAVWEPEIYTIHFDADGGKGELKDAVITYGNAMRMPNSVVKDGYYLRGWAKTAHSNKPDYKLGMDYQFESDTTLYAVWGSSTWSGQVASSFAGGDGTSANPYQISNASELAYLASIVNSQTDKPEYKYYTLVDNIDLGYTQWIPIGIYDNSNQYFNGMFDGNGYTISGLYLTSGDYTRYGLFGYVKDSEIKNLTLTGDIEDVNIIDEYAYFGGLIAHGNSTQINNVNLSYFDISNITASCSNSGNPTSIFMGCLVGKLETKSTINNCHAKYSSISVENKNSVFAYMGGICGSTTSSTISDCSVENDNVIFGRLKTNRSVYLGGIAGSADKIVNCKVSAGRLTHQQSVTGAVFGGGICGNATSVKNCNVIFTNKDTISFNGKTIPYSAYITNKLGRLGGIVAENAEVINSKYDGASLILICNSNANIFSASSVGGICGGSIGSHVVKNSVCDVDGILYCSAPGGYLFAGGLIGNPIKWDDNYKIELTNSLASAKSITAKNSKGTGTDAYGYTYGGFAGDIAGFSYDAQDVGKHLYTNDDMTVEGTSIRTLIATTKSEEKIRTRSFQKNLLGLNEYSSLSNLDNDDTAVWVLEDGKLPELYYNVLREITVSPVENGTVKLDKTQAVDGEVVTVTAEPEKIYMLNKIYVNGKEIVGTTFEVDGDSDVYVTFAEETPKYNVSLKADANADGGLVNVDAAETMGIAQLAANEQSLSAEDGQEIRVNASADSDYTIDAIRVNGEEIAGNSFILTEDSTVTMDVANISIEVPATTNEATDVSWHSATVSGTVSESNGTVARYIIYWTETAPEEKMTTEVQEGAGVYTVTLENLSESTHYYYQMTENGEVKTFTTMAEECAADVLSDEAYKDIYGNGNPDFDTPDPSKPDGEISTNTAAQKSGNGYHFDITCSQELNDAIIIVGIYNAKNVFIGCSITEADGRSAYTMNVTAKDGKYARICVWKSFGDLRPLGEAEIVPLN